MGQETHWSTSDTQLTGLLANGRCEGQHRLSRAESRCCIECRLMLRLTRAQGTRKDQVARDPWGTSRSQDVPMEEDTRLKPA